MQVHARARLTPKGRLFVVHRVLEHGWSPAAAADAAGVAERTVYRWLARFRSQGEAGLRDRSSAPKLIPHRTPANRVKAILALRRLRMTAVEISELLELPPSTVSAVLRRKGLGRLSRLEPPEPPNRYERSRPGELIHVDVKKLGRIGPKGPGHRVTGSRHRNPTRRDRDGHDRRTVGWEFVHVAVDDATRLAHAEVLGDERGETAVGFLRRAVAFFASHGVRVERVMTDNGSPYVSAVHAAACRELGIRHLRTRPYRPRTNGKAERFIQTMLRKWAYGAIYRSSLERTRALPGWLDRYNWRRPHGSLGKRPPGYRLARLTKVAGNYT
jgi:transposase InsO family protein